MAVLERMLRDEESHQEHSVGFLSSVGERPQFVQKTEEFKQERLKDLRRLLETIRSRCEIRNCVELAYLEPEKRNTLVKLFGQHGAESVMLSSESGCALWTDDLALAGCAREVRAVNRVWTHLLLQDLAAKGKLDDASYLDATARLTGWGYFFTSINAASVLAAGRIAGWNPGKWPLKQALRYLQLEAVELGQAVNLAKELIVRMSSEDLLPESKNMALIAVLENLEKRERGLDGILAIRKSLRTAFGLNVIAATDAEETIDAWLSARKNRIVRI